MKKQRTFSNIVALVVGILLTTGQQASGQFAANIDQPLSGNPGFASVSPMASGTFMETFDGDPGRPQPFQSPNWDVTVHSRDVDTWDALEPMQAMHGPDCGPPPATHTVTQYQDAVFQCKNHLMTAIDAGGYGVIYLTPNQIVDFSTGEAVIKFDLSTARTSLRDWIDIWISPYSEHLQLPLDNYLPDLSGNPRRGIHIAMDQFNGLTTFKLSTILNFNAKVRKGTTWVGYESFLTPDAMRRDTFELHISRTHIKFGMPAYNFWWFDTNISKLNWTSGVVQFGHHSYNPTKDCTDCAPNTWHWDNISLSPASSFSMVHANQRFTDVDHGAQIDLEAPAPAAAMLQFSGIGGSLMVSFNNGTTWIKARVQPQKLHKTDHFWSYWMPIPAGTQSIRFKGKNWYGGGWRVQDLSVWAIP